MKENPLYQVPRRVDVDFMTLVQNVTIPHGYNLPFIERSAIILDSYTGRIGLSIHTYDSWSSA